MTKGLENKDKQLTFEREGMAAQELKETVYFKLVEQRNYLYSNIVNGGNSRQDKQVSEEEIPGIKM